MSKVKIFSGSQKQKLEIRAFLNWDNVRALGKPTTVERGVVRGFTLPVYNNDDEELFFETHIPHRWDGASDICIHTHCYLAGAEDDHAFRLQITWEHYRPHTNGIVPNTSNEVEVETLTGGSAAQFKSFEVDLAVDYDIDGGGNELTSGEELAFRLIRVAEEGAKDDCDAGIVITHVGIVFQLDKVGVNV